MNIFRTGMIRTALASSLMLSNTGMSMSLSFLNGPGATNSASNNNSLSPREAEFQDFLKSPQGIRLNDRYRGARNVLLAIFNSMYPKNDSFNTANETLELKNLNFIYTYNVVPTEERSETDKEIFKVNFFYKILANASNETLVESIAQLKDDCVSSKMDFEDLQAINEAAIEITNIHPCEGLEVLDFDNAPELLSEYIEKDRYNVTSETSGYILKDSDEILDFLANSLVPLPSKSDLRRDLTNYVNRTKQLDVMIAEKETEITELHDSKSRLENNLRMETRRLEEEKNARIVSEKETAEATQVIEEQQKAIEALKGLINKKEEAMAKLKGTYEKVSHEKENLSGQVKTLNSQVESQGALLSNNKNEAKNALAGKDKKIGELQAEINTKSTNITKLQTVLTQKNSDIEAKNQKIQQLDQKRQDLEKEIAEWKKKIKGVKDGRKRGFELYNKLSPIVSKLDGVHKDHESHPIWQCQNLYKDYKTLIRNVRKLKEKFDHHELKPEHLKGISDDWIDSL